MSENPRVPLLNVNALASVLGVSRQTIWRWKKSNPTFPRPIRVGSKGLRFSLDAVKEWLGARARRSKDSAELPNVIEALGG